MLACARLDRTSRHPCLRQPPAHLDPGQPRRLQPQTPFTETPPNKCKHNGRLYAPRWTDKEAASLSDNSPSNRASYPTASPPRYHSSSRGPVLAWASPHRSAEAHATATLSPPRPTCAANLKATSCQLQVFRTSKTYLSRIIRYPRTPIAPSKHVEHPQARRPSQSAAIGPIARVDTAGPPRAPT